MVPVPLVRVRFLLAAMVTPLLAFRVAATLTAPALFPILTAVVAPPPKLIVVAVVFSRSKLLEPVDRLVVIVGVAIVGLVAKTATPVPVSSVRLFRSTELAAESTTFLDPSRNRARLAVSPLNVSV